MTKRISSILLVLLLSASVLASCGKNNGGETANDTTNTNDTNVSDTTADESTENSDTTEDTSSEETAENNETAGTSVTSVKSAADAIAFIENNVYSQVPDQLPMMMMTIELDLADADSISYNTGLTDLTGITSIILSESGVGSFAYSFVYVMTDGTNTSGIQTALGEKIQPNKWVCVSADKISSIQLDNDIILVMGSPERVDNIMNAVVTAADGVYENVGDVVAVMG